jgi:serine/threonine-protein kinase RsbT
LFEVSAVDDGPGIANLDVIMKGQYRSRTGLGRGIVGTKALLDELEVDSAPGKGTRISGHRRARK